MKHTKIVATIGPASQKKQTLVQMMNAGMNVARLNFSHGSYEQHTELLKTIRAAAEQTKKTVAILQDIQGPRIRTGVLPSAGLTLQNGDSVILVSQKEYDKKAHAGGYASEKGSTVPLLPIQFENLYKFVHPKGPIYIQDGLIELRVQRVASGRILCRVMQGGVVYTHKGLNAPGAHIKTPVLTPKDKKDIAFGVKNDVDYLAVSFVQTAEHIKSTRKLLPKNSTIKIIAKIEHAQAVQNFDAILEAADGIMVARGDLGVEIGSAAVPVLQKELVQKCVVAGKPVIVATQMLESMTLNPRPTRAEAADVANAVIDHADALMLSGETANGAYPVKAVQMMSDIIQNVEKTSLDDLPMNLEELFASAKQDASHSIAHAAVHVAEALPAKVIVVVSATGRTARYVAQLRPQDPVIVAIHPDKKVLRQMQLIWGVQPMFVPSLEHATTTRYIKALLKKEKLVKKEDAAVIVTGFRVRQQAAVVEAVEI